MYIVILSDGTRNVIAIGLADESECEARLAAPLRLRAIGANRGLLGVRISRLDALESWLPLCGRQSTEAIVQEAYVPFAIFCHPVLTGGSVHRIIEHDVVRAVGLGLATSRECT